MSVVTGPFTAQLAATKAARSSQRPLPRLLSRRKSNLDSILGAQRQRQAFLPWTGISALHGLELLQEPYSYVARFCQRILLSETDSRAAVEGQVFPSWPESLPPLWFVLVCVGTVDVLAAVHRVG